ncbi:hypothetical protein LY76DRAFT_8103 [Colletotrichum caudatum]|nr:hypothetical protein LY76DRAFT_8103 [Colletotrichum caudatum]
MQDCGVVVLGARRRTRSWVPCPSREWNNLKNPSLARSLHPPLSFPLSLCLSVCLPQDLSRPNRSSMVRFRVAGHGNRATFEPRRSLMLPSVPNGNRHRSYPTQPVFA